MTDIKVFKVGEVVLTRVPYFDVELPPETVALTAADIEPIAWATPVWAESSTALRVGQAIWVIEAGGQTIVVDPCCASDAFLRTGDAAIEHQTAAFAAFRAAGFDPATVDVVIMSHLDGIGMNALVDEHGAWQPAFPNAPIVMSELEWERVGTRSGVSGAEALSALFAAGHVTTVALPHSLTPEVTMVIAGGHTPGMATIIVESNRDRALFLGHLAVNPLHAAVSCEVALHDDPALGAAALRTWLANVASDDALVIGPLWPSPGAARVASLDPLVLEPADGS